jgi:hypothetical protein
MAKIAMIVEHFMVLFFTFQTGVPALLGSGSWWWGVREATAVLEVQLEVIAAKGEVTMQTTTVVMRTALVMWRVVAAWKGVAAWRAVVA